MNIVSKSSTSFSPRLPKVRTQPSSLGVAELIASHCQTMSASSFRVSLLMGRIDLNTDCLFLLQSSIRTTEPPATGAETFQTSAVRSVCFTKLSTGSEHLRPPAMRHGLPNYEAGRQVPFFKDRCMIDSFKILITQLLNRVNSINGRRYGDDPTVLAWQTGNEMRLGSNQPAPGAWTHEICSVRPIDHLLFSSLIRLLYNSTSRVWLPILWQQTVPTQSALLLPTLLRKKKAS